MAFIPALNILPLTACFTLALPTSRITAAIDIISISMVSGIDSWVTTPSTSNDGRSEGALPNTITSITPNRNASTLHLARGLGLCSICAIAMASASGSISPSRTRRWYSGSSFLAHTVLHKRSHQDGYQRGWDTHQQDILQFYALSAKQVGGYNSCRSRRHGRTCDT